MRAEVQEPAKRSRRGDDIDLGALRLLFEVREWRAYLIFGASGGVMTSAPPARDVLAAIAKWQPARLDEGDIASLEPLLPRLREWVTAVSPSTADDAKNLLYSASRILLWMSTQYGITEVDSVLNRENINEFIFVVEADRENGWKLQTRSALHKVRRALMPDELDRLAVRIPAPPTTEGYSEIEELGFRIAAELTGYRNMAARKWLPAAALGAGLNGREIVQSRVEDLIPIGSGRLAVQVRGRRERLAPIRSPYTALARAAAAEAQGGRFLSGRGANTCYDIASRLNDGLSLARARSTWVTAHLRLGTPVPALLLMAGTLSPKTIQELSRRIARDLTPTEAALQGLTP